MVSSTTGSDASLKPVNDPTDRYNSPSTNLLSPLSILIHPEHSFRDGDALAGGSLPPHIVFEIKTAIISTMLGTLKARKSNENKRETKEQAEGMVIFRKTMTA